MNLKQLETRDAANEGEWMEVLDDGMKPTGFELLIYGEDSHQVQKAKNKLSSKMGFSQRRGGRRKITYDDAVEGDLIMAFGASGDWRVKTEDGSYISEVPWGDEMLEFTPHNVRAVYTEFRGIVEQVLDYMEERSNFTRV